MTFKHPMYPKECIGCPLYETQGGFVPPKCSCQPCSFKPSMLPKEGCLAELIIIGTTPEQSDIRAQTPFVGAFGRYLMGGLKWVKLDKTPTRLTYLTHCRTLREGRTKLISRPPTKPEVTQCSKRFLLPTLQNRLEDSIVVPLGPEVFKYLGEGNFLDALGQRGNLIIPTFKQSLAISPTHNRLCKCGTPLAPRKRKCPKCRKGK